MSIFHNFSLKDQSERIERRDETRTQWALNVTRVYGKLAKIQFSKVKYLQIKKIVQVPGYPTFFGKTRDLPVATSWGFPTELGNIPQMFIHKQMEAPIVIKPLKATNLNSLMCFDFLNIKDRFDYCEITMPTNSNILVDC